MNKIVYIKTKFKPIGKKVEVQVPTGESKGGLFGKKEIFKKTTKWKQIGISDKEIDGVQLAQDIDNVVRELNNKGYEVVSITPITSGNYERGYRPIGSAKQNNFEYGGYGYGFGFSYTEGVVILGKKVNQH